MDLELELQYIAIGNTMVKLFVPLPERVKNAYLMQKAEAEHTPFPYWAKVWPSAIALSEYILKHPDIMAGKEVVELAAGLGLPSLVAAPYAKTICCSDYLPEALAVVNKSIAANNFSNVYTQLLDWNHLSKNITPDVLLLSDINYDLQEFNTLQKILLDFLHRDTIILLSSPQRLMAKTFIQRLLPWCAHMEEITVSYKGVQTLISVFVLKKPRIENSVPLAE
jgi:predicted nicotinamide N-methyase